MYTMSTYHHGDLRTALLRAAGKRLEKQGIATLSLREAARRVGVSHNAPYRHFADREALPAALAAQGFDMLGQAMRGQTGRGMGEAYVRFALQHPRRLPRGAFRLIPWHIGCPVHRAVPAEAHGRGQALFSASAMAAGAGGLMAGWAWEAAGRARAFSLSALGAVAGAFLALRLRRAG